MCAIAAVNELLLSIATVVSIVNMAEDADEQRIRAAMFQNGNTFDLMSTSAESEMGYPL